MAFKFNLLEAILLFFLYLPWPALKFYKKNLEISHIPRHLFKPFYALSKHLLLLLYNKSQFPNQIDHRPI